MTRQGPRDGYAARLPIGPLLSWIESAHQGTNEAAAQNQFTRHITDSEIALMLGAARGTVSSCRQRGWINHRTADQWAVALGLHPLLIWPDFHIDTVWQDELELELVTS